jgi:signal transduction histidine kinase
MKRRFGKFSFLADRIIDWITEITDWITGRINRITDRISIRALKIITILCPVLFIVLIYLLWRSVLEENRPTVWGTLGLFFIVLFITFLFSKFVFAITNHLQEEYVHRMAELETLNELNTTVDEFHNLNVLLNRAMDKIIQITAADAGELYLVDEQSRELVHALHCGLLDNVFKPENRLQLKEELVSEGAGWNHQVTMKNLNNYQSNRIAFLTDVGVHSLAIIPLSASTENIGVICLFSLKRDYFKTNEADFLLKIGNRIAMAIEKARLYEKVRAVAIQEERERISKELHDGLAQVLGFVITKSQATRQLLRNVAMATEYLVELENVAQEVYTDTRETILGLRTAIIGNTSMTSALREHVVRFNQMHGIKTDLIIGDHIIPSLSPQIELQAIRIVQEALSNVRKHAKATHATVAVTTGESEVNITVEDDGTGFDVDKVEKIASTKLGLRNMKERADSIHSHLFVESKPENGTRVTLRIPLKSSQAVNDEDDVGEEIESSNS